MLQKSERDKLARLYEDAVKKAQRYERAPYATQIAVRACEAYDKAEKAFYDYLDALSAAP